MLKFRNGILKWGSVDMLINLTNCFFPSKFPLNYLWLEAGNLQVGVSSKLSHLF